MAWPAEPLPVRDAPVAGSGVPRVERDDVIRDTGCASHPSSFAMLSDRIASEDEAAPLSVACVVAALGSSSADASVVTGSHPSVRRAVALSTDTRTSWVAARRVDASRHGIL